MSESKAVRRASVSAVAVAGTAISVLSANRSRRYLLIQNTAATDIWVSFGKDATTSSPSIKLGSGKALHYDNGFAPTNEVSINGAAGGETFSVWEA